MRKNLYGEYYAAIRIHVLNSDGEWKDTKERRFPIAPIPGDFINLSDGSYEVIKRVIEVSGSSDSADWDATITVRQVG